MVIINQERSWYISIRKWIHDFNLCEYFYSELIIRILYLYKTFDAQIGMAALSILYLGIQFSLVSARRN